VANNLHKTLRLARKTGLTIKMHLKRIKCTTYTSIQKQQQQQHDVNNRQKYPSNDFSSLCVPVSLRLRCFFLFDASSPFTPPEARFFFFFPLSISSLMNYWLKKKGFSDLTNDSHKGRVDHTRLSALFAFLSLSLY